jgi:hypothetical protein
MKRLTKFAVRSSKTSVRVYETTRRHIPEENVFFLVYAVRTLNFPFITVFTKARQRDSWPK